MDALGCRAEPRCSEHQRFGTCSEHVRNSSEHDYLRKVVCGTVSLHFLSFIWFNMPQSNTIPIWLNNLSKESHSCTLTTWLMLIDGATKPPAPARDTRNGIPNLGRWRRWTALSTLKELGKQCELVVLDKISINLCRKCSPPRNVL